MKADAIIFARRTVRLPQGCSFADLCYNVQL